MKSFKGIRCVKSNYLFYKVSLDERLKYLESTSYLLFI
ncbi:hypothetical protein SA27298_1365 [Streptococcus anginosus]|nr:hypothetical protein SA27298_1365 [Streptococcus anginosus]